MALAVTLLLAGVVSGFASASPDGLEAVAGWHGFADTAAPSPLSDSPVADYQVAGVESARVSGGLAGVLGVLLTLAVTAALARALRTRARRG